ncbi:MAG: hypothetical protein N2442_14785 [Spirochaetes bacterium]|nr:hypothetical protein [Spirochaetota bacterium]
MHLEWKVRVLNALQEAVKVVANRKKKANGKADRLPIEGELEAITTIALYRVVLQMRPDLRKHPNYRHACRVLEELPLWSVDREFAMEVIDCVSSILGLPFRYYARDESFCTVDQVRTKKIKAVEKLLKVNLL